MQPMKSITRIACMIAATMMLLSACTDSYRQFLAPDVKVDRKHDVLALVDGHDPQGIFDRISSELVANGFDVRNSRAIKNAAVQNNATPGQTKDGAAMYALRINYSGSSIRGWVSGYSVSLIDLRTAKPVGTLTLTGGRRSTDDAIAETIAFVRRASN